MELIVYKTAKHHGKPPYNEQEIIEALSNSELYKTKKVSEIEEKFASIGRLREKDVEIMCKVIDKKYIIIYHCMKLSYRRGKPWKPNF